MSTITLRSAKGAPLTNTEVDNNFSGLNTGKMEKSSNLGDVVDTAASRTNLDVYSKAEAESAAVSMAIALG